MFLLTEPRLTARPPERVGGVLIEADELWLPGPIDDAVAALIFGDDFDVAIDQGRLEPIP